MSLMYVESRQGHLRPGSARVPVHTSSSTLARIRFSSSLLPLRLRVERTFQDRLVVVELVVPNSKLHNSACAQVRGLTPKISGATAFHSPHYRQGIQQSAC